MRVKELAAFIKEREAISWRKLRGEPRPWTKDPILATFRFCNVHREDDAVTMWIHENVRGPHEGFSNMFFVIAVCRLFNLPSTLSAMELEGFAWQHERNRKLLKAMQERGEKVFNSAYIVSTNGIAMNKIDYLFDRVIAPLKLAGQPPLPGETLESYHEKLTRFDGLGSFLAAQVVADMKYIEPLLGAPDWDTWAAPGPGSRRGLNRVYGKAVEAPWPGGTWLQHLTRLREAILPVIDPISLHAQDLQNCLCEFDKYERARLGEGRPKQLYTPEGEK